MTGYAGAHALARSRLFSTPDQLAPWRVAAITLAAYGALVGSLAARDGIGVFLHVGSAFTQRSDRSTRISGVHAQDRVGYDGQFAYFIALDPRNARYYIDRPAYRYGRILYPAAAWAAAAGRPGLLPYTLLAINVLAVAATVYLLAAYLRRRSISPWWAAVYGFFPGVLVCVSADLTEPLAFCLVACALTAFERAPRRVLVHAPLFALAALTRETTLVFPVACACALALRGRRAAAAAAATLLVAAVPVAAYRLALDRWLGSWAGDGSISPVPFGGLTSWPLDPVHRLVLLAVVLPGVVWLVLATWVFLRRRGGLVLALAALNAALFVVWLPADAYLDFDSAARQSAGLALAAVFSIPLLRGVRAAPAALALLTGPWLLAAAGLAAIPGLA